MDYVACLKKAKNSKRKLYTTFSQTLNQDSLKKIAGNSKQTFLVAITPRSGSSYFMDLLAKTRKLGEPGEYLNPSFVPNIAESLEAQDLSEYWLKLNERKGSKNIFGIKASFFHFVPLIETGLDQFMFNSEGVVYLARQNIVDQAISLYLATQSDVFHTNIEHSHEKWERQINVAYNEALIREWIVHIRTQELGWEKYLKDKKVLQITYEDIALNPQKQVKLVLKFLNQGGLGDAFTHQSVFKKISNKKNEEFADLFLKDIKNIDFLAEHGIDALRYCF